MGKATQSIVTQLQHAIRSRDTMATARKTPLNIALADALYRHRFISWVTTGFLSRPDPSYIATHTPEELARTNFYWSPREAKRQLWMGLRYLDSQAGTPLGGKSRVPAMRAVAPVRGGGGLSLTPELEVLARLTAGEDHKETKGLVSGDFLFLETRDGMVLESREAVERGVTGRLFCQIWSNTEQDLRNEDQAVVDSTVTSGTIPAEAHGSLEDAWEEVKRTERREFT